MKHLITRCSWVISGTDWKPTEHYFKSSRITLQLLFQSLAEANKPNYIKPKKTAGGSLFWFYNLLLYYLFHFLLHGNFLVTFNYITFTNVIVVSYLHTTVVTFRNFFHIIFETF